MVTILISLYYSVWKPPILVTPFPTYLGLVTCHNPVGLDRVQLPNVLLFSSHQELVNPIPVLNGFEHKQNCAWQGFTYLILLQRLHSLENLPGFIRRYTPLLHQNLC